MCDCSSLKLRGSGQSHFEKDCFSGCGVNPDEFASAVFKGERGSRVFKRLSNHSFWELGLKTSKAARASCFEAPGGQRCLPNVHLCRQIMFLNDAMVDDSCDDYRANQQTCEPEIWMKDRANHTCKLSRGELFLREFLRNSKQHFVSEAHVSGVG